MNVETYKVWCLCVHPVWRYKSNATCWNWVAWGGFGSSRVIGSSFDRVHITSYLTLTETMRLLCTIFV